jgi:hypothetical protein
VATVREPVSVGVAVFHPDWLALDSVWAVPTSPLAEMDTQLLKQAGKRTWLPEHVVCAMGGCGKAGGDTGRVVSTMGVEGGGPAVSLIQHVS